ncbi:MAG: MCP four helix bundle domain-containing protein [Methylacidiphilales bacterium]|nr:MCP four helix bundle domain-containing protein [Candidatus Methylacidiphilales bacterium]
MKGKEQRIFVKTILIFTSVLIVGLIVSGVYQIHVIGRAMDAYESVVTSDVSVLNHLQSLTAYNADYHRYTGRLCTAILDGKQAEQTEHLLHLQGIKQNYNNEFNAVKGMLSDEKFRDCLKKLEKARAAYEDIREKLLELSREGRRSEVEKLRATQLIPTYEMGEACENDLGDLIEAGAKQNSDLKIHELKKDQIILSVLTFWPLIAVLLLFIIILGIGAWLWWYFPDEGGVIMRGSYRE